MANAWDEEQTWRNVRNTWIASTVLAPCSCCCAGTALGGGHLPVMAVGVIGLAVWMLPPIAVWAASRIRALM